MLDCFDFESIPSVRIKSRGSEMSLKSIFKIAERNSGPLHDYFVMSGDGVIPVEVKTQVNDQWFDVGKYCVLSEEDARIPIVFVLREGDMISSIIVIRTKDFVDMVTNDDGHIRMGWSDKVLRMGRELKQEYPQVQFKVKAKVKSLFLKYPEKFLIAWQRDVNVKLPTFVVD